MTSFSRSTVLSLVVFYIFFVSFIALVAFQVLNNDSAVDNAWQLPIIISMAIAVPVILVIIIVINFIRLFREKSGNTPGVLLKIRLIFYFFILIILAAGPQIILSLSFIQVIGNTWFNEQIGEGLESSLNITINIQRNLSENLEDFAYSVLFENLSTRANENANRYFTQIRQIRPSILSVQVFLRNTEEIFAGGDEDSWILASDIISSEDGLVIRDIRQERSFIRIHRRFNDTTVVLIEELPSEFASTTLNILDSLELFNEYQRVKNILLTGIIVFYGFFSLPLIFLAILAGFFLSNVLIQPIVNLETAMRKVAEGDFGFRILSRSQDILGSLVYSFNKMIIELGLSRNRLVQSERVAAWKDIAQRLAHEIKNPLTPIKLSIERLERKYQQESKDFSTVLDRSVKTITYEVEHLSQLITEFRDFARLPSPRPDTNNLQVLVQSVIELHHPERIRIIDDLDTDIDIFVDSDQFRQVMKNLLLNAIDAIGDNDGEIRISSQPLQFTMGEFLRICIQDNGKGIPEKEIEEIFNPYYTTKSAGTGLGLAIVQRIIQDHNGTISVESEIGQGTRFYIDLPQSDPLMEDR